MSCDGALEVSGDRVEYNARGLSFCLRLLHTFYAVSYCRSIATVMLCLRSLSFRGEGTPVGLPLLASYIRLVSFGVPFEYGKSALLFDATLQALAEGRPSSIFARHVYSLGLTPPLLQRHVCSQKLAATLGHADW